MKAVRYALALGSLMYVMLCTRPDICYAVGMVNKYQSIPGQEYLTAVKHILKYLRTRDYIFIYGGSDLIPVGYKDMCSLMGVKLSVGRVSSNNVLLTQPLK